MRSCLCYISVLFSVHPPRSPLPRSDFGSQLVGMLCATLSAQMKVCSPEVVGKLCATPSAQILHSAACRTAPRHSLSSENEGIISECHSIPSGFGDASSTLLPRADLDQARLFQINGISWNLYNSLMLSLFVCFFSIFISMFRIEWLQ